MKEKNYYLQHKGRFLTRNNVYVSVHTYIHSLKDYWSFKRVIKVYCGIITYVEVLMKRLCSTEPPQVCGGQQGPDNLRLFGGSHWCPRGAGDDFSLGHPENAVWG